MKYDVIIIGCGPAGLSCAEKLSEYSKKILIVEKDKTGGVCTNYGCIPTKSLLYQSWHKNSENIQFSDLIRNAQNTINLIQKGIEFRIKQSKTDYIKGTASILDQNNIMREETGEIISASYIVISTGSLPAVPKINGINRPYVYNSTSIMSIPDLPDRITIIGGGVIGIEYACIFNSMKKNVTILETQDNILSNFDDDIVKSLKRDLSSINICCNITNITIKENKVYYTDSIYKDCSIDTDIVLNTCGRTVNLPKISPDMKLKLTNKNYIEVNDFMQTSYDNIYAIGDVTGLSMLAHSAELMGKICAMHISGETTKAFTRENIPSVVYSYPELALCGLTEKECLISKKDYRTGISNLKKNGRFLAENSITTQSFIKVLISPANHQIIGIQAICPYASELAFLFALIIKRELRTDDISDIIAPHPSVSEALYDACMEAQRNAV